MHSVRTADAINAAWLAAGGYGWICLPWKDDSYQGPVSSRTAQRRGSPANSTLLTVSNDLYDKLFLDTAFSTALTTVVGTTYTMGDGWHCQSGKDTGGIVDAVTPEGSVLTPARHLHIGAGATDILSTHHDRYKEQDDRFCRTRGPRYPERYTGHYGVYGLGGNLFLG